MATRLYLTAEVPDLLPAVAGDWTTTASMGQHQLNGAPDGSALATVTRVETSATVVRHLIRQQISGPVAAGSIAGTLEVALRTSITNVAANAQTYVVAKVVSGTGTLRGVLYAGTIGIAYTTTLSVHSAGTVALSSVAAVAGDRVVVEVGVQFNNVVTTSWTASMRLGAPAGAAVDLTNTNGGTADNRPWIEFSATLPFLGLARTSAELAEVLGTVDPPSARGAGLWVEALGLQLPVEAGLSVLFVEALGLPKPVEAALSASYVEVLGVPGTEPVEGEGLQNVARTGTLRIKHPDGTWQTPQPLGSS